MLKRLILAFVVLAATTSQSQGGMAQPAVGPDCIEDVDDYLALDFWTFDQDPERGWRSIVMTQGCELAAADLIAD